MILQKLKQLFSENQIMVVLFGIIAGLIVPSWFRPLATYSTHLLVLIFFCSSLRLEITEIVAYAKDWKMLLFTNSFMLIILPIAMWLPLMLFAPDWAMAFLILGAMPTGMTIALIADLFGGKTTLALVITATTSLLAPLTIPLLFLITIGRVVPVPVISLFSSLFISIVLPFIVATWLKSVRPKFVKKYDFWWREISIIAFGVLIAAIVADTTGNGAITISIRDAGLVFIMLLYMAVLVAISYFMNYWRTNSEKATIALCIVYLNNTLSLYIANKFFPDAHLMTQLVILLLVINILLPPFRWIAARAVELDKKQIKSKKLKKIK
ncbi:bile acid:sodium symporter [Patescibacteria group bacterium]|nr:bile acid:sodium symporter [Patescibacteria group bacterium]